MESEFSRTPLSSISQSNTPILIMTVEIGEGAKDNIIIYQSSVIEEVVSQFSNKHSLNYEQELTLISQIREQLQDSNPEPYEISRTDYFKQWNSHVDKHLIKDPPHHPKINQKSALIMQNKQVLPVYERLYSLSNKPQSDPVEEKEKPKGTQCGNRLYNSWMAKKQQKDLAISKIQSAKEEEIAKSLTFKPQINSNVSVPIGFTQDPITLQRYKAENLERKRFEQLAKEQEICTFTPRINPVSDSLLQQKFRLKPKNKFLELYEEATIRKEKNEELVEQ